MSNDKEQQFAKHCKDMLDYRLDHLENNITVRLRAARQQALYQPTYSPWWVPASGLVAVTVLSASLFLFQIETSTYLTDVKTMDFELLSQTEQLDLYENLDFYVWLAEEDVNG